MLYRATMTCTNFCRVFRWPRLRHSLTSHAMTSCGNTARWFTICGTRWLPTAGRCTWWCTRALGSAAFYLDFGLYLFAWYWVLSSGVPWVIGARGRLQFCRPQKSWDVQTWNQGHHMQGQGQGLDLQSQGLDLQGQGQGLNSREQQDGLPKRI